MSAIARNFMVLAVISAIVGMAWGIQMSASGDHALSPAHAHLNLLGWVSMAIFAFYYHLIPSAASGVLAKAHFGVAALGLLCVVPGIVMALSDQGDTLAKLGSVLSLLSIVIFLIVVLRSSGSARSNS